MLNGSLSFGFRCYDQGLIPMLVPKKQNQVSTKDALEVSKSSLTFD